MIDTGLSNKRVNCWVLRNWIMFNHFFLDPSTRKEDKKVRKDRRGRKDDNHFIVYVLGMPMAKKLQILSKIC